MYLLSVRSILRFACFNVTRPSNSKLEHTISRVPVATNRRKIWEKRGGNVEEASMSMLKVTAISRYFEG